MGSEIAAQNRRSLATFHRTLKSQCSTAFVVSRISLATSGSAMGIAIANRKIRCDFGALSFPSLFASLSCFGGSSLYDYLFFFIFNSVVFATTLFRVLFFSYFIVASFNFFFLSMFVSLSTYLLTRTLFLFFLDRFCLSGGHQ